MYLEKERNKNRYLYLDLLRALAILLVLGAHNSSQYHENDFISIILRTWKFIGWCGVDLFFVLSGFLISGLVFKDIEKFKKFRLKRFFIRRSFKIYPSFLLFLCVTFPLYKHVSFVDPTISQLLSEAFFLRNYIQGYWVHTWSLCVEEHFYLSFPIFVYLILKYFYSRFYYFLILFLIGIVLMIIFNRVYQIYVNDAYVTFATHHRMDSILWGVIIRYFFKFHSNFIQKVLPFRFWLLLLSFILISPIFFIQGDSKFMHSFGVTFLYIGFGIILLIMSTIHIPRNGVIAFIAYIGQCSYLIYLWHLFVRRVIDFHLWKVIPISSELSFPLYMLSSITFGILLTKVIEEPILKWRDQKFP